MKTPAKLIIALSMIAIMIIILVPADASKPAHTGIEYPQSDSTGTITGRVTSPNITIGIAGAYVAIVNGYDISQEYANTTSDSNGNYTFTGVNATGDHFQYQIYANKSQYGEGYSTTFGVNANASYMTNVVIFLHGSTPTLTPTPTPTLTPTPTPTLMPTPTSTPTPTATPTSTAVNNTTAISQTSSPTPIAQTPTPITTASPTSIPGQSDETPIYLAIGAIVIIVLVGVVYFWFFRK